MNTLKEYFKDYDFMKLKIIRNLTNFKFFMIIDKLGILLNFLNFNLFQPLGIYMRNFHLFTDFSYLNLSNEAKMYFRLNLKWHSIFGQFFIF